MNDATPVIRIEQLVKRYGRQTALDKLSLDVPRGVVFGLLGENGAGKTTAIRILLGLVDADSGGATALGLDSRRHGVEIRRRVGYVPERPVLYEWMTIEEIGWFTAGFYGGRYLSRFGELIRQYQAPYNRRIGELSKGMRAKVALALAMASDPELLVLDEPTSGLDTLVRREFLENIVEIAATGRTVFLSSHQIGEVERVADIVAILKAGRLLLAERLDSLKGQTRELTITLVNDQSPPEVAGEIVRERRRSRQWQVLVRGLNATALDRLKTNSGIEDVVVRAPTLEEIFVAVIQAPDDALPKFRATAENADWSSTDHSSVI